MREKTDVAHFLVPVSRTIYPGMCMICCCTNEWNRQCDVCCCANEMRRSPYCIYRMILILVHAFLFFCFFVWYMRAHVHYTTQLRFWCLCQISFKYWTHLFVWSVCCVCFVVCSEVLMQTDDVCWQSRHAVDVEGAACVNGGRVNTPTWLVYYFVFLLLVAGVLLILLVVNILSIVLLLIVVVFYCWWFRYSY